MLKIFITTSVVANFLIFIFGSLILFEKREIDHNRLKHTSFLILAAMTGSVSALIFSTTITSYSFIFGLTCIMLSVILFFRCAQIIRTQKITPLHSTDVPSFVLQRGPYKYIRHPFYASYILAFLGSAIASSTWWSYSITGLIFYLYHEASLAEEEKFVKSHLAAVYQIYRQSAGRFTPRLNRKN